MNAPLIHPFQGAHDAKMWGTLNREQRAWLVALLKADAQVIAGLTVELKRARAHVSWWSRLKAWLARLRSK